MNAFNSILIEGIVTADPVTRETPRGTKVCTFSIASNRFYKTGDEIEKEVSYFDIETWSRLADTCGKTLAKGRGVRVVGRLKQDRWSDAEGKNYSRVKVVAEHVEFKPAMESTSEDSDDVF